MKIAFLNIFNGVMERGSEVFVAEIAKRLAKRHEVTVYQMGISNSIEYQTVRIKGIPFVVSQNILYHLQVLLFTLKCLPYLFRRKYDWIIPVNGRFQVLLCRLFRFIRGGKILITGHAGVGFEDKFNIIIGKPDIFIVLSPRAYQWAGFYTSSLTYIPNGVDLEKFNPSHKAVSLDLERPIVFCNSALLPYKRIDLAVNAVARLKNASLLLIGTGPLREQIENLGRQLLGKRFKNIAYVANDQIANYYRAADVFTLVSEDSEAFGLVYLEALASNIPVVAPDDANRREIIGDGGLFCHPQDINEYAKTIAKALRVKWGTAPRQQAEKFSWEVIVQKYEDVFDRFLNP